MEVNSRRTPTLMFDTPLQLAANLPKMSEKGNFYSIVYPRGDTYIDGDPSINVIK